MVSWNKLSDRLLEVEYNYLQSLWKQLPMLIKGHEIAHSSVFPIMRLCHKEAVGSSVWPKLEAMDISCNKYIKVAYLM
jgi:hypothetical protein